MHTPRGSLLWSRSDLSGEAWEVLRAECPQEQGCGLPFLSFSHTVERWIFTPLLGLGELGSTEWPIPCRALGWWPEPACLSPAGKDPIRSQRAMGNQIVSSRNLGVLGGGVSHTCLQVMGCQATAPFIESPAQIALSSSLCVLIPVWT